MVRGGVPHLGWTANLRRRLTRLLVRSSSPHDSLAMRIRQSVTSIECWATGSKLEASLLMYQLAKVYFPDDYPKRLRLRMPWFVGLTENDRFPRLTLVNRISRNSASLFGPFSNRESAERYEQELLGLFQIRRCTEVLAPHPEHPGCIYGEMKQCLRPCQCVVTEQEYASESKRVGEFLATNGRSAIAVLSAARDRACEGTDFEQAAQIHKRMEKVNGAAAARDEVIRQVQEFNGVALTRDVQPRHFRLWPMFNGFWQEPVSLHFSPQESHARSLDHELREQLSASLANARCEGKRVEDLALFSRWYYSSWRDGHWFDFRSLSDLNYRRLVREISKMVKTDEREGGE